MPVSYNASQIAQWFDAKTMAKARHYVSAVSDVYWLEEHALAGSVQGTRKYPYEVRVAFGDIGKKSMWVEGECSCPVGYGCKHVVALLIAGLAQQPDSTTTGVRTELVNWLEGFRIRCAQASVSTQKKAVKRTHVLAYAIDCMEDGSCEVSLRKARVDADGAICSVDETWHNVERALVQPPRFVQEEDLPVLGGLWRGRSHGFYGNFILQGATGAELLGRMVATGRAFSAFIPVHAHHKSPLHSIRGGSVRHGKLAWETRSDARLRPALQAEPAASLLLTTLQPCWYIDANTGEAGALTLPWPAEQLADYLSIPAITSDEAELVGMVLRDVAPALPAPPTHDRSWVKVVESAPEPVLMLDTLPTSEPPFDFATVSFDYAGHRLPAYSDTTLIRCTDGTVVQIRRNTNLERKRLTELQKAGFRNTGTRYGPGGRPFPADMLTPDREQDWANVMKRIVPELRAGHWRVEMSEAFRHNVIEIDAIDGSLHQSGDGWFDVEMGITVNGRTVRLEPLLSNLFRRDARWLSGRIDAITDDETIELKTDRNERICLRADRIKPVVRVLVDLFDSPGEGLRIYAWDAARLHALDQTGRWQFHGDASIRRLAQRLMAGPRVTDVPVPSMLMAELRPYQRQGLAWMQFLREHDLSGVLADDMGLGKTIQTLAHILVEKESGRLDRPALIVLPTTLVHNWCDEARRFAPSLRVLDLHGSERHERFAQIGEHDLVLTTYALLWRDQDVLAKYDYHLLILDEAQYVKNAATRSATAIRELRARHRLCLTGTPLENHLGELWAQFDFLLPGFLGSRRDFTRIWRTPIEKSGDVIRRDLLARRIRPFMLRRRKDEVATELPPKTMILRTVDLEGAQRDLYETVRAAMQKKVREAVAAKGLARSHIIVLDALLKLRQTCCDPRLVKIAQAARVKESAKLDLLLDMLPELIGEGRRILLFSQFTGMLDLIAAALDEVGITYVMLTGETTNRVTPIKRFNQGRVPLFLISLKAGGVGLNLTTADTVIHYDPWWNPAAENQATDRAHRLGQDKPVFVYKLIAAGSVEEKIVAMQEKKAVLAEAILSEDAAGAVKFSEDDIEALFEPIPATSAAAPRAKQRSRAKRAI
ncbi:MAG TPA: DEAD/DEAH box helicase [Dyella sp.]|uniref:DEAD/DEAH box helicase n=1 Tax=Dyella sp. TaxID=1869338 RepID=UPI002F929E2B